MTLTFEPIRLDRQAAYLDIFGQSLQKASDYSFVNIWSWSGHYGLEWAWSDNRVWLRQTTGRLSELGTPPTGLDC
jgi:hypothetical protein